jgi:hypothetical protein
MRLRRLILLRLQRRSEIVRGVLVGIWCSLTDSIAVALLTRANECGRTNASVATWLEAVDDA